MLCWQLAVHFWCLFSIVEQCQDYTVLGIVLAWFVVVVTVVAKVLPRVPVSNSFRCQRNV